jgi:hypothetical protein
MISMTDHPEDKLGKQYREAFNKLHFSENVASRVQYAAAGPEHPTGRPGRTWVRKALAIAGTLLIVVITFFGLRWYAGQRTTPPTAGTTVASTCATTTGWSQPTPQVTIDPKKYIYNTSGRIDLNRSFFKTSLAELEADTSAVIIGTPVEIKPENPSSPDAASSAGTYVTIRVDKVLKPDGRVQQGQNCQLYQWYNAAPQLDDTDIIEVNLIMFALPLRLGEPYLLFLTPVDSPDYHYEIAGDYQGKFPLNSATNANRFRNLTAEQMEFPTGESHGVDNGMLLGDLWQIAAEAYDKYFGDTYEVDSMEICRVGSNRIMSTKDADQLRSLSDALNLGNTPAPDLGSRSPDFTLISYFGKQETDFSLYIEEDGCYFVQAAEPGQYYRISGEGATFLRGFIQNVIKPYENGLAELGVNATTNDLAHLLRFPAADLSQVPQPAEGSGCLTAGSLDALAAVMDSADGRVSIVLPGDGQLQFEQAILRDRNYYEYRYRDSQTENVLFYDVYYGRADFIPDEWGMKKTTIAGQVLYRKAITNSQGLTVTAVHWEWQGWSVDLRIQGKAANSGDFGRYIALGQTVYHSSAQTGADGSPLIGSQATIDALLAGHADITFERHRNYLYTIDQLVETTNAEQLAEFVMNRLGHPVFYTYDCVAGNQSLIKYRVENDGNHIMTIAGQDVQDPSFYFNCWTIDHPAFIDEMQAIAPSTVTLDFGSLQRGGITYFYSIVKNYQRYLTEIRWLDQGCRCGITLIGTAEEKMTAVKLDRLLSGVRKVTR